MAGENTNNTLYINRQTLHRTWPTIFLFHLHIYPQDHIGAAGFVYDHFTQDGHSPTIIASKRIRADLRNKDARDPRSVFSESFSRSHQTLAAALLCLSL